VGVLATEEQWDEAQAGEEHCWMVKHTSSYDDRSKYYLSAFYNYNAIPAGPHAKVLEIGCGPFTQSKIISSRTEIESVTLVDPLLDKYLSHPYCSYNRPVEWFKEMELVTARGEDFCRPGEFDMAICINILTHCQDAAKVVSNLIASLKVGGVLVFGEPTFPEGTEFGGLHPIAPTEKWIREQLTGVKPLYENVLDRDHYIDFLMIGKKRGVAE
jgi:SAM-dependent methyltransferase